MKKNILTVTVLLIVVSLTLTSAGECQNTVKFTNGSRTEPLPVTIFDNVIYLPVQVNNSTWLDFVLDTGASDLTAVDEGVAKTQKFSMKRAGKVGGAGAEKVPTYTIESMMLSLPGLELNNFRLITIPLKRMEPYWGIKKDGLLGGDFLSKIVLQINYDKSTVSFSDPNCFNVSSGGQIIPLEIISRVPLCKAKITPEGSDQFIEGLFILDTGVRMTFFNTPFTSKNKLIEKSKRTVKNIVGFGIGGKAVGIVGRLGSIKIGNFTLENPIAQLCNEMKGVEASTDFDGIIGADILSRFHVIFDYTHKHLILEKNSRHHEAFEYDMSGIYFITEGPRNDIFKVVNVIEHSPAERAGIKIDDIITAVNGKPMSSYTMDSLKKILKQINRTVHLTLRRKDAVRECELTLERLL